MNMRIRDNRRFHAQSTCCPVCGPRLEFRWLNCTTTQASACVGEDALAAAQRALAAGAIVAIKRTTRANQLSRATPRPSSSLQLRAESRLNQVALSGGVFQNSYLLGLILEQLDAADFKVLVYRCVPPNDGGLALGQLLIAAHQDKQPCV